jgi:hypothetical protein
MAHEDLKVTLQTPAIFAMFTFFRFAGVLHFCPILGADGIRCRASPPGTGGGVLKIPLKLHYVLGPACNTLSLVYEDGQKTGEGEGEGEGDLDNDEDIFESACGFASLANMRLSHLKLCGNCAQPCFQ